jgi:hypothetical protein
MEKVMDLLLLLLGLAGSFAGGSGGGVTPDTGSGSIKVGNT